MTWTSRLSVDPFLLHGMNHFFFMGSACPGRVNEKREKINGDSQGQNDAGRFQHRLWAEKNQEQKDHRQSNRHDRVAVVEAGESRKKIFEVNKHRLNAYTILPQSTILRPSCDNSTIHGKPQNASHFVFYPMVCPVLWAIPRYSVIIQRDRQSLMRFFNHSRDHQESPIPSSLVFVSRVLR